MWFYNDKEIYGIKNMPKDVFVFIYETIHIPTGKKYIGKKSLMYNQKKKLTKKELAEQTGPGRKPTHKQIQVESDWKTYYGSHGFIKDCIKECPEDLSRQILQFAFNKKELTYLECKWQFSLGVLESREFMNDNIQGRFFDKDFY